MGWTVAVIAAGGMGAAVAARLVSRGAEVLTSLDGRSAATIERARAAGMAHAEDDRLAAAYAILSIVPPDQALPLAERFGAHLRASGRSPLYVDLNAVSSATARAIGQALGPARYVDGSIIGYPPKPDDAGPRFYVSGPAATDAQRLRGFGLDVRVLQGEIGAASALKMTYAGLTKGFLALGTAMVRAAQREGAADALQAELAHSQPEFLARFARSFPDMLPKAYRWVPEMEEIAAFLGDGDPASGIYRAMARLYAEMAADQRGGDTLGQSLQQFAAAQPRRDAS